MPVGSTGPDRLTGGCTVAVYVVLPPTPVVLEASREVDVESGTTVTVVDPVAFATPEAESGVKSAVTDSGEVDAANEAVQVAAGVEGVIGSPIQPAIGRPPFAKVTAPDGTPGLEVTAASSVTLSFVTAADGNASRDRLLPLNVCVSDATALRFTEVSVAVIAICPGVVELLMSAL